MDNRRPDRTRRIQRKLASILLLAGLLGLFMQTATASAGCANCNHFLSTATVTPTPLIMQIPLPIVMDSGVRVHYFLANASAQSTYPSYQALVGDKVKLVWYVTGTSTVYIDAPDNHPAGVLGPLPAEGSIDICPATGSSTYILYAGGKPLTVPGVGIGIWVSPSALAQRSVDKNWKPCWE